MRRQLFRRAHLTSRRRQRTQRCLRSTQTVAAAQATTLMSMAVLAPPGLETLLRLLLPLRALCLARPRDPAPRTTRRRARRRARTTRRVQAPRSASVRPLLQKPLWTRVWMLGPRMAPTVLLLRRRQALVLALAATLGRVRWTTVRRLATAHERPAGRRRCPTTLRLSRRPGRQVSGLRLYLAP